MDLVRQATERLARKTSRRGLFGRGAEVIAGALFGAAAGTLTRPGPVSAGVGTVCFFPGPPCPCDACTAGGTCGKPCVMNTTWYSTGCWVTAGVTCCDCDCNGFQGVQVCGCGSDYHNDPQFCPSN